MGRILTQEYHINIIQIQQRRWKMIHSLRNLIQNMMKTWSLERNAKMYHNQNWNVDSTNFVKLSIKMSQTWIMFSISCIAFADQMSNSDLFNGIGCFGCGGREFWALAFTCGAITNVLKVNLWLMMKAFRLWTSSLFWRCTWTVDIQTQVVYFKSCLKGQSNFIAVATLVDSNSCRIK